MQSLVGFFRPLCIPLMTKLLRTYVVVVRKTIELLCVNKKNYWGGYKMDVSIWGAVHLHSIDGWALSGADVQAPWPAVLEIVWLHCDEAQQVGCLRGLEGCPLVLDAGIQSRFARHRWWQGQWGGYEHCGTRQERSTLQLNSPGIGWLFATLLLQHLNRSLQATSGAQCVMLASCEVTQGVGDTWATCPTLLQGIWARSRRAGFSCCIWL